MVLRVLVPVCSTQPLVRASALQAAHATQPEMSAAPSVPLAPAPLTRAVRGISRKTDRYTDS